MKCDNCKTTDDYRWYNHKHQWFCRKCTSVIRSSEPKEHMRMEYVHLKHYGKVLKSRLTELSRRRIIPGSYNPSTGEYKIGRMSEGGKIQERRPSY